MKNNDKGSKDGKIISFPGLKDRLLAFGLEHLDHHRFEDAANLLGQAYELDPENQEIGTAFLLALYESGNYEKAKDICRDLLHEGIGNYFEIIDVYLMILIQLRNHEEVIHTINVLMEEDEVPFEKMEHYKKLYQFSQNRLNNDTQLYDKQIGIQEAFFTTDNINENIYKIAGLANQNIYPYLNELIQYLSKKKAHPFLQTMVLNVLREHGIEKEIHIKKFHFQKNIQPLQLKPVFETSFYLELMIQMKEKMEHDNPSLFIQLKEMVDRHFFLLYPFELEPTECNLWLAAYLCMGKELYGEFLDLETIANEYDLAISSLVNAIKFIKNLEEISLPNL